MKRWRRVLLGMSMIISFLIWGHDPISSEIGIVSPDYPIPLETGMVSPDYWWHQIPAFFALFGFCGCLLILLIAKALGKFLLQKKEDYYDAD